MASMKRPLRELGAGGASMRAGFRGSGVADSSSSWGSVRDGACVFRRESGRIEAVAAFAPVQRPLRRAGVAFAAVQRPFRERGVGGASMRTGFPGRGVADSSTLTRFPGAGMAVTSPLPPLRAAGMAFAEVRSGFPGSVTPRSRVNRAFPRVGVGFTRVIPPFRRIRGPIAAGTGRVRGVEYGKRGVPPRFCADRNVRAPSS